MTSYEIARLVERMADVLELTGENVFRIRVYRRTAQNLETLSEDVEPLAREHRLEDIPGVDADLASKIDRGPGGRRSGAWLSRVDLLDRR
jgi:DNA polymerase (family 10)